ncbi:hypothetical protein [Paractinoplanes globisporus]|uniref:Uncharacterized protein n=1 Tax=Paractinoplanes globisporus TaxID=113565 RepID=A0ABW6WSR7_9ACTN|nr:hypothetical protein [Actinoplanes globisporus]
MPANIDVTGGFVIRQRRAKNPLYDLHIAGRRVFWVAACAGIIVFGSLMGSAFVSQQYLQNVLGYSTLEAGAAERESPLVRPGSSRRAGPGSPCSSAAFSCCSPASHSLTGSVPVQRAGMASGTADRQRDLGGALLSAGYATAFAAAVAVSPDRQDVSAAMENQLTKSFSGRRARSRLSLSTAWPRAPRARAPPAHRSPRRQR